MVNPEELTIQAPVARWQRIFLVLGIIGIVFLLVGFAINRQQFWASYLMAYFYIFGFSLTGLGMTMIIYLAGGRWGAAVGDVLRAESAQFWLLAILFVPIAIGAWVFGIYSWTNPVVRKADPIIQGRGLWMTLPMWTLRAVLLFTILILISRYLLSWFQRWDETGDPVYRTRMRNLSGAGLVIVILGVSFGFFDWYMSLEPDWYSTIYGLMLIIGDVLSGWALMLVVFISLRHRFPVREMFSRSLLRDVGSLMVAMTILWAYASFSQFMLIWVGNLADEIPWYLVRGLGSSSTPGWAVLGAIWLTTNFIINFPAIVMRGTRKSGVWLRRIAFLVVIGRFLEAIWLIEPDLVPTAPLASHWVDIAAVVGLGGIWMYFFLGQVRQRLTAVSPAAIFPAHAHVFPVGPSTNPEPGAAE